MSQGIGKGLKDTSNTFKVAKTFSRVAEEPLPLAILLMECASMVANCNAVAMATLHSVGVIDSSTTCTTLVTTREDDDWEGVAEDDSTDDEIKVDSLGAALGLIETPGTFEAVDGSGSEETALDCFDVVV